MRRNVNKSQTLYKKAKKIIPGGTQLLSKRAERFLPDLWPSYYQKAQGCEVWDMDGRHYYDFAQMGVGSCVLGYADPLVNKAVMKAICDGSMCTLNCFEEVELAEKLCELHPWAKMVRFARTGGEACAIAIRIARAATKRSKVVFCGYHGWHDWYLSANLGNLSKLDGQLLPGLDPNGVPRELRNTALPFNYNRIDQLEAIVKHSYRDIAAIIMEPVRNEMPEKGFLEKVRKIATRIGSVLIFDEITSGFRMNLGGIHLNLNVEPDIAVFGKALGNGFPIAAIIGRKQIMDSAQTSFISSTFWTERIGYVAALATLKAMKTRRTQGHLIRYGTQISEGWRELAQKHQLQIRISGIPPLTHISFLGDFPLEAQTLYAQEMLERGYLVGAAVYATGSYTDSIIRSFIKNSDPVFSLIAKALRQGSFKRYLKSDVVHTGFKRLT